MSSLFGNTNNNTNTGGSGLFGTNNNVNPQSSLFSNSATSQPASSVFKFPSLSTTQQQKPNLFSPSSQQTSTQPTSSDLFGSQTKNTQSTSAPISNLFNSSTISANNTQPLPNNSTVISSGLNAPNQSQNTAYFDSILDKSRKRTYVEPSSDDLPQLQLGLGDLRQRIKRLGTGIEPNRSAEAHYLLAASGIKPGEAIRDLNNFASATGYNERSQPLAQPDTDIETYLMNLQTQTTLSMIQDGLARSVRDFNNFLEDNVTMEWSMQKKRIFEHFGIKQKEDTTSDENVGGKGGSQGTFVKSRRNKPTGLAGSQIRGGDSVFGRKSMFESVIGTAGPVGSGHRPVFQDVEKQMEANNIVPLAPHDRLQRDKQTRYAEKVTDLNIARIQKYPYPLCTEFISVVEASSENHGPDLIKAYKALIEITGENPSVKSLGDPRVVGERHFATTYLEESSTKQKILLKKKIIRGGSRCLEKLAFKFMEETITKNPREASLGGIPDVINKVKAYVRLQASRKNLAGDNTDLQMLGDDYVWALIYSLLRTGHIKEADQYVKSNVAAFRAIDRNFASYIHAYASDPDRRLPSDLQIRINGEYNQRLRIAPGNSIDPYRMVCYKIVGRCDLKQRHLENIPQSVEDFAWVQVVLAREINRVDAVASEIYGLAEAQNMVKEIGHRFFSKGGAEIGSSFGAFVFLQIAVGLFEEAVSYLYSYNYVDGVHLAITLGFYGLLRAADPSTSEANLLSLTIRNQAQISFGPMLALYTRDFRTANVSAAVDYIVLMCLNKDVPGGNGRNQLALCHEALRELILESREFANLLGDMRSDGQRVKGIIEERTELIDLEEAGDFFRTITLQAASQADDNGRVTDAILLYHLAEEYDSVISTLNRALAQAVSTPLGQTYERLDPVKQRTNLPEDSSQPVSTFSLSASDDPMEMARTILVIYGANRMFIEMVKPVNIEACGKLQIIQKAKNCVENEQWSLALDIMNDLAIIPLSANGDANAIRALANAFTSLAQPLAATVPHLLMWSILCSNKQREILAASLYGGNEGIRLQMVEQMRQINMDLMTFVGQLRYRLPASLHEALARSQGI